MTNQECTEFLQWALPKLHYRWGGFRKVRGQVCKRLQRRLAEIELSDLNTYKNYLSRHQKEWHLLDSFCRITISRFYRDRGVFNTLRSEILPRLTGHVLKKNETELRCWSAGCASGEEPYSLQIVWKLTVLPKLPSPLPLRITATDADARLLERAHTGHYPKSSLRDLPREFVERAFERSDSEYTLLPSFKENIEFLQQDIREEMPGNRFHLLLCCNLAFTYFDIPLQRDLLKHLYEKLLPGGFLVIGSHESLPETPVDLSLYDTSGSIFQKK